MQLSADSGKLVDNLMTATAAVERYGAKPSDLKGLPVAKSYYSKTYLRDVTLLAVEVVEVALVERKAKLGAQGKALAAANESKQFSMPAGWPVVGSIAGASRWAAVDTETTGLSPADGHRVTATT